MAEQFVADICAAHVAAYAGLALNEVEKGANLQV
jgi:hypothetical protein